MVSELVIQSRENIQKFSLYSYIFGFCENLLYFRNRMLSVLAAGSFAFFFFKHIFSFNAY
jgi:hypothetical protein